MVDLSDEWLSQSRCSDARCLYKYKLIHVDKLVRRWTPGPMRKGTLVHAGLEIALWYAHTICTVPGRLIQGTAIAWGEAAIRGAQAVWLDSDVLKGHVTDEMRQGAAEQCEQACSIFRRVWAFLDVGRKWETVCLADGTPLIEYKMRAPRLIPGGWAGAQGTLDWVARDLRTGHVWLFDLKTLKALQSDDYHAIQLQAPLYQYLLMRDAGLKIAGTATLQVRSAVPAVPKMNKTKAKGEDRPGMSRAKCATTPEIYRQALLDNDLDPENYRDVLAELRPFDRISYYFRSWEHVTKAVGDLQNMGHVIALAGAHGIWPRNANPFSCRGCTHREYCEADLNGEDTEELANTLYMREGEDPYPEIEWSDDDGDD